MKKAVVLLSGGIDSTVTLAIAKNKGYEINALSFDYGQRHYVELNSSKLCASYFDVTKHTIFKFDLKEIGASALTADIEVPKRVTGSPVKLPKSYASGQLRHGAGEFRAPSKDQKKDSTINSSYFTSHDSDIPVTYVPARNTMFLSFALGFAESIVAQDIFIGANAVDYSGYPDCRPEFISAFENMANLATKASVEGNVHFSIQAPLISLTKAEIIKKGAELGVDFALTWSCYDPQKIRKDEGRGTKDEKEISPLISHPTSLGYSPCQRCDSCLIREKGFKSAGIDDPLIHKAKH